MQTYFVALADDHALIRNGIAGLINTFEGFRVLFQAGNGAELIENIKPKAVPDIVLMDINMPKKDGYETTLWLKNNYPDVKVLALSMYDNETAIIRMLKNGACGYILKDAEPADLKRALHEIINRGFYYSELVTGHLMNTIHKLDDNTETKATLKLTEKEVEFLKYCCTDLTYHDIAEKMCLSPRTIEGYRDSLFDKLKVRSRVVLVIYTIKNAIVSIDTLKT